jgi:hypothetical protein
MNIKVESFDVTEEFDDAEGHVRMQPGGPMDATRPRNDRPRAGRLVAAGPLALDISVQGHALILTSTESEADDDAEGHIWRPGRLVELHNDVVEVSDGDGKVRRYVRVGGSARTTDAANMRLRYGPRF